jgi:hypothetical protein
LTKEKIKMAVVNLKIEKLPESVSESRLHELLSMKGKVINIQTIGTSAFVQIDSTTIRNTLLKSSAKTMGLSRLIYADSSGIGELKFATVSLI